ncbi:MAG: VPLPA-CTERM sorting domain-containing protein [Pseudomonadota bacterium]
MHLKALLASAAIFASSSLSAVANTVDFDLMFVIDRSGSMSNEFTDLADNLEIVFNGLNNASGIGSLAAGLIVYEGGASQSDSELLVQDLTTDVNQLKTAINGVSTRGGTENALIAVDSAIPGGNSFLGVSYRPNTVRSIVLITDEDADDESTYSVNGQSSYAGLGAYLDDAGYLNNIITSSFLFNEYEPAARPEADPATMKDAALFDLAAFNADPAAFLTAFTNTKVIESQSAVVFDPTPTTPGVSPVPLPAAAWLMIAGLGGLGFASRRKKA